MPYNTPYLVGLYRYLGLDEYFPRNCIIHIFLLNIMATNDKKRDAEGTCHSLGAHLPTLAKDEDVRVMGRMKSILKKT